MEKDKIQKVYEQTILNPVNEGIIQKIQSIAKKFKKEPNQLETMEDMINDLETTLELARKELKKLK